VLSPVSVCVVEFAASGEAETAEYELHEAPEQRSTAYAVSFVALSVQLMVIAVPVVVPTVSADGSSGTSEVDSVIVESSVHPSEAAIAHNNVVFKIVLIIDCILVN